MCDWREIGMVSPELLELRRELWNCELMRDKYGVPGIVMRDKYGVPGIGCPRN